MRIAARRGIFFWFLTVLAAPAIGSMTLRDVRVGRNLQVGACVRVERPGLSGAIEVTVTSADPARLLLAAMPDVKGVAALKLKVPQGSAESPDFWIQALGESGSVPYTATAEGMPVVTGTVTLAPSAVVLRGPGGGLKFQTTPRAAPARLIARTVMLDGGGGEPVEQMLAGGSSVEVRVTSSNARVGHITNLPVSLVGPETAAAILFQPAEPGETLLTIAAPPGFTSVATTGTVTALVNVPGIALMTRNSIGQNLQLGSSVGLGEPAPKAGLVVTLTSGDPKVLLLSADGKSVGSSSIHVKVPPGGINASYWLQALGGSGEVTYTASAPGYRTRTATLILTPSGVMITPAAYGPPDEGEFLQPHLPEPPRQFVASVSAVPSVPLMVWTAQLDPATKRGADITVQPLRAGLRLQVSVQNTDPGVGTVDSAVTIEGGSEHATTQFQARKRGSTVISLVTPAGFITPSNGTRLTAVVQP